MINGSSQSNVNPYSIKTIQGYTDNYCNQTFNSVSADFVEKIVGVSVPSEHMGSVMTYSVSCSYVSGGQKDIVDYTDNSSQCKSTRYVKQDTGKGSFSVLCTAKHGNTDFGGSSVSSLGGDSANSASSGGSSSSNGGSGASAGGSAGGKGAVGGSSASSAGSASADGKNGGSGSSQGADGGLKGSDGSNSGGGSGSGNGLGNGGSGSSQGADGGLKGSDGSNSGGGSGSGGGGSEGSADFPEAPDGGGQPDWGGLKSDGGFGSFSPSSAFSTGGYCPQDLVLDFGDFGRHNLTISFVCEAAGRLRYVFITLAYFVSAMMIFKTVNSMKG